MVVPMFHFFQAKTAKAISGTQTLDDADDQRAADAPLVAQRKFKEGGEGFGKQCGTGLAHNDCSERAGEQPESVEQTLETGVTPSNRASGAEQTMSQPQKMTPDATAMIAATTISTTRHL